MKRRIGPEQATELLREWIENNCRVSLIIVFAKNLKTKFSITLTGGTLEQAYGKDSDVFQYIGSAVGTMVVPSNFECCERYETDDVESLILSDPEEEYKIFVYRPKENESVLFAQTQLSTLLN